MTKIKAALLSCLIGAATLIAPAPARAVECDQLSTGMRLCLPRIGTDFDQWGTASINAWTLINSSGIVNSTTTAATFASLVATYGVKAATAAFGSAPTVSTFTTTGDLTLASNADLTLTGPTAYATFPASVTASAFYGDGSNITGISIDTSKLATDAVTTTKILNNAVTMAKLATSGTLPALDGSALINLPASAGSWQNYGVWADTRPANTAGTAATTVSFGKVALTSEETDGGNLGTLAVSSVTLIAGTYDCDWRTAFNNVASCASQLVNSTSGAVLGYGDSCVANTSAVNVFNVGTASFTFTGAGTIEIQTRASGAIAPVAMNLGIQETYTKLRCRRK